MSDPYLPSGSAPLGRAYEILEEGKPFGGYTIARCLAYDMLGSLYLATNQQTGHNETLFVFPTLVGQDAGFPERFNVHSKKLCALKHPNVLSFTHPLIIHNNYCLVGEAFECLSLPDHLMLLTGSQLSTAGGQKTASLPSAQVTPIIEQVLAGLAYAHECKVMHLNLNPTKVLRAVRGEVKVYGYHFLAILGQELFETLVSAGIPPLKLDPNRSFLGTTDILSPEARLRKELEYRSDIYAVGVDTHWLLTGAKPVSPYLPPSKLVPGIEAGWDAFTTHCLQRKLDDRYASTAAALADLRNIAQLTPLPQAQPLELLLAPEQPAAPVEKKKAAKEPAPKKVKLPHGPRRARKQLTLAQRLLFFGLPALLAVALVTFLYVKVETSDDAEGNLPVRAQPGDKVTLLLKITPATSLVSIDKSVFNVTNGTLALCMPNGTYTITVESPPKYLRANIDNYTTEKDEDKLYINLVPAWATVDFQSAPGATIVAQPSKGPQLQLGVADANGKLHVTKNLGDDTYTFTATKTDYSTASVEKQKIDLTKSYHIDLPLTPKPSTITFNTDPPGVTVLMDGKVLGVTNFTTTAIPVDTDVHLTLEKRGFQSVPRTLRIAPNMTFAPPLGNLTAHMGALDLAFKLGGHALTPEELRDAKILVNNQPYPASTTHISDMLEGSYSIVFQHPDYEPVTRTVAITDSKTSNASADLQPRPARVAIHVTPMLPIAVLLNNKPIAPAADGTYVLPPGQKVKVRVTSQNYADAEKEFDLGPNQSADWPIALSRLSPPTNGQDFAVPYLDMTLKWIQPGQFNMGSPGGESQRLPSEGPMTAVVFSQGFWAGQTEVTQGQYQDIMGENPSTFGKADPNWARYPVEGVSWQQAREFTQKLTERERTANRLPAGYEYRLPTEAEWEYFARAGTTTPFWFGDHADPSKGNFKGTYPAQGGGSGTLGTSAAGTKPVGSYSPNAWGLYDVCGNVNEWVLDAYKARLPGDSVTAPALQSGGPDAKRAYRGGGWSDFASDCRSAWRDSGVKPDTASSNIGLRVVLAPVITATP